MAKLQEIKTAIEDAIASDATKTDWTDQQWTDWFGADVSETVTEITKTDAVASFAPAELLAIGDADLERVKVALNVDQVPINLLDGLLSEITTSTITTQATLSGKKTKQVKRGATLGLGKVRAGDVQRAKAVK